MRERRLHGFGLVRAQGVHKSSSSKTRPGRDRQHYSSEVKSSRPPP
jgi:hypothetical protein